MMKTEKRKANVGERILITNATISCGNYENGDTFEVHRMYADNGIKTTVENMVHIRHSEYEVIVETPKKSARITALETQVATLQAKVEALESAGKYPLTERFERESTSMDAILADIERKAKPTLEALLATYPTPNQQRADVIKRAKAFVVNRKTYVEFDLNANVEFIVNVEKRTVVALINRGTAQYKYFPVKGIAKCDPDDVFNADIGKAIALARALGVEVPVEFVKAVQPTEVVVGMVVQHIGVFSTFESTVVTNGTATGTYTNTIEFVQRNPQHFNGILDDTDAVYE